MKICILSTYDIKGGAARAAYRLHSGLRLLGHESCMIVRHKSSMDLAVRSIVPPPGRSTENQLLLMEAVQRHAVDFNRTSLSDTYFSLPCPGFDLSNCHLIQEADVINLHWVSRFQSPRSVARIVSLSRPVVWTLHDQGPFTGGCHYSASCDGYSRNCRECPQLLDNPLDFPAAILEDKLTCYGHSESIVLVSPSRWLAECARRSRVFQHARIEIIPNGVESDVFIQRDSTEAKARLGLHTDTATLLFCSERASEKRKGFHLLVDAMEVCMSQGDLPQRMGAGRLKILCMGEPPDAAVTAKLPILSLGHLSSDDQIAWGYAAADVFVLPSTEDNLPNTVLEAMSCGIPVAAFDVGGLPDIVSDGFTGRLAPVGDAAALGRLLAELLMDSAGRKEMSGACRRTAVERYGLTAQAACYAELFQDVSRARAKKQRDSLYSFRDDGGKIEAQLEADGGRQFAALSDRLMLRALKELVPHLEEKLAVSEADRAARLEIIHDYHEKLGVSEAERAAHNDERIRLQQTITSYRVQVHRARVATSKMQFQIDFLNDQLRLQMTTNQSLRNLTRNVIRRIGELYFIHRYYRLFARPYRAMLRTAKALLSQLNWRPKTGISPLDAPVVEAFVQARGIHGELDDLTLISLFEWGAGLRSVICLNPSNDALQATFVLSRAGAVASAITMGNQLHHRLDSLGILPIPYSFEDWLASLATGAMEYDDAIVVDLGIRPDALELLKGKLHISQRLVVTGSKLSNNHPLPSTGTAMRPLGDLFVVDTPPSDWLAEHDAQRPMSFGETMPSGRPWPKISVVTVTLNQGDFLEQTLRSVLDQGYPNLEYIVLDGGSSDKTIDILNGYRDRLSVCISEPDHGQAEALNRGFAQASGQILAWLNSDDRYESDTLRKVALTFDHYQTDMVVGACSLIRDFDSTPYDVHHSALPYGQPLPLPLNRLLDIDGAWQKGDFFYQPEVFWSRGIWERAGGYVDEELYYSMDYELWVRMARQRATITHIPDTLALYRVHRKQKTSGPDLPFLTELSQVNRELLEGKR